MSELFKRLKDEQDIKKIYLHMQYGNKPALTFYKKTGFVVDKLLVDYYSEDIVPRDCYFMRYDLNYDDKKWLRNKNKKFLDVNIKYDNSIINL